MSIELNSTTPNACRERSESVGADRKVRQIMRRDLTLRDNFWILLRAAVFVAGLTLFTAQGDTIYRETFGNAVSTRQNPNIFGWQTFQASGAQYNTIDGNHGVDTSATL